MAHVTDGDVEGFVSGALAPMDRQRVVRHLISGCAMCGARISAAIRRSLAPPPREEASCKVVVDRAFRKLRRLVRRWKEDQERLARGLRASGVPCFCGAAD